MRPAPDLRRDRKGPLHMKLETATAYVARCFNGEPASCSCACPFSLDIRAFLEKIPKGRWVAAYKLLRNAVVFPAIVGALCDQPCRAHCQRSLVGDEALAIRDLEEACGKWAKSRKAELYVIPPKTQRIAVVGAGPAGLACALCLAQKKYIVTVFDKEPGWGGSLRQHPRFPEFEEDFKLQFAGIEVEFRYNAEIHAHSELAEFDAVYVATGKGGGDFGLLGSWDSNLLTTSAPKVFLGGELTGVTLMEAIAMGNAASKTIESFLLAGRATGTPRPDRKNCDRYLRHDGAEKKPLVLKSDGQVYTEDEAKAEAARCFQCDCSACEASCEMLKWFRKKPHRIGMEVYTDSVAASVISARTMTRETYSCNICGHCKAVCPVDVDMGALLQFSRTDRVNQGKPIPALHDYWLREMDFNATEGAFASAPQGKQTCTYAFFPGCKLGAANPQHVLKAYEYLREKYDAGVILNCCGAPAYWAGEEQRLAAHLEEIKKSWTGLGKPTLVFACAYCEKIFRQFLPEIPQVSLYKLLAQDEKLIPAHPFAEATVFDPCAARDDLEMEASVRSLALKAGIALSELKEPNRCCGFGGHMRQANPELYEEIILHRAEASDRPYIVYCANCREVFRLKGKPSAHVLDMVFSLDPDGPVPSLQEKKENTLEVKKIIMDQLKGQKFVPEKHDWDGMKLIISDALLAEMDRKLIVADDLKEAIWRAEKTADKFVLAPEGVCQCSMVKSALTYWVQYKATGSHEYKILDAYSHRMRFSREG